MKLWTLSVLGVFVIFAVFGLTWGQNNSSSSTTATTTPPPTTTISPQEECMRNNATCETCLKFAHCLWCYSDNSCKQYPTGHVLPRESDCPLDKARWGVCWVNFKILIIVMSCLGGVILITSCCCVYCCCCRGGNGKNKLLADESKYARQKEERKKRSDERRTERKAKTDEIRRKYGLVKNDNPYSRFDADA